MNLRDVVSFIRARTWPLLSYMSNAYLANFIAAVGAWYDEPVVDPVSPRMIDDRISAGGWACRGGPWGPGLVRRARWRWNQ